MVSENQTPDRTQLYTPSLSRKRFYDGALSFHTICLTTTAVYQVAKDWLNEY
ncbi:hypothetical protein Mgra_00006474, partial [Meloidogyne graminicola]